MQTDALEAALLSLPLIEDCAVLPQLVSGSVVSVAYLVLRGPVTRQKIESHLSESLPGAQQPDHLVFVNRLPYDDRGALDEAALSQVPIADEPLARRFEETLGKDPRFLQTAVVLSEPSTVTAFLHERQLLPPTFASPNGSASVAARREGAAPTLRAVERLEASRSVAPPEASAAPMAECEGPPLSSREGAPRTLPDALRSAASRFDDPRITYLGLNQSVRQDTFSSLLSEARRIHGGLKAHGITRGQKLLLQLERPEDVLPAFWGCLLGGIVPVMTAVPPSYDAGTNDIERLARVIQLLGGPRILAARRSADMEPLLARAGTSDDCVIGLDELRSAHAIADERDLSPDAPAFLTLTSGSTGTPKAVMLSHSSILSRARGTNRLCRHLESDRILNWLPFDHIGSISDWHLRCVILGCHMSYCTKEYVLGDPLNWLRLIDRLRVTHSWAPNFAYALVHDAAKKAGDERWDLSCLQTLLTAGEAVSSNTVRDFLDELARHGMAPTVVRPAFGMAELGSGVTYYVPTAEHPVRVIHVDRTRLDGKLTRVDPKDPCAVGFTSLGPVIPSARMRIVDDEERLLPEGCVGRLQIGGDPVCLGYYENPEANREVFASGGWFNTGDRGFISGKELYLTGRDKESLVINGANYHNGEIEAVVSAIDGVRVSFTAACAVRDAGDGERLAVFFSTDVLEPSLRELLAEIQKQITTKIGVKADYLLPVPESAIPKTAIGKIQRKELVKRFERGEFEALVRRTDLLQQNERTIPDWFLEPAFRPKAIGSRASRREKIAPRGVLVIDDPTGLSMAVALALRESGVPVTSVPRGGSLPRLTHPLTHVLDFTDYGPLQCLTTSSAHRESVDSVVRRLTELARTANESAGLAAGTGKVRYLVIASHAQAASAEDAIDDARSVIPVALMTLAQELPALECTHLDVPFALSARDLEAGARVVLSECASPGRDPEVAYRARGRLVRAFRRVAWSDDRRGASPPAERLERGGLYLITGGLGGVGAELSRYLLERWGARLVVVGRSPAQGPSAAPERRAVLADLERRGTVDYAVADVTDPRALKDAVARAEARAGQRVRGAFHLASAYREAPLGDETAEALRAALLPKVLGAAAVHAAVPDSAFVVCFTSLAGVNGGAGIGAYAAANRMVDALCHTERRRGRASYSASWSVWKGLGIGAESAPMAVLRSKGYHSIAADKGFASLVALLGLSPAHYAIGADPDHPTLAFRVEAPVTPRALLLALVAPRDASTATDFPAVADVLGNTVPVAYRLFRGALAGASGQVGRDALLAALKGGPGAARVPATTRTQRKLAEIWQTVLGLDEVGINEVFFDIGGTSLLALRLFAEVERAFGTALPLSTLYRASTIETLAALLDAEPSRDAPESIRLLTASSWASEKPGGGAPLTLHLVHDSEGKTDVYHSLAARLEGSVRVYAVAPHSEGPFPVLYSRIEDMAAHAANQIRRVQPTGPYAVGGLGIGGALAHAVACRLQEAGEVVASVVLFDAVDAVYKEARPSGQSGVFRKVDRSLAERLLARTSRLSTSLTRSGMDYARLKLLRRCLDRGDRPPWYLEHIPLETIYRFAAQEYAPRTFSGRMVLYRALDFGLDPSDAPARGRCGALDFGWTARATLGTAIIDVPGGHRTMLAEPNVAPLARHLTDVLTLALSGNRAAKRSA